MYHAVSTKVVMQGSHFLYRKPTPSPKMSTNFSLSHFEHQYLYFVGGLIEGLLENNVPSKME